MIAAGAGCTAFPDFLVCLLSVDPKIPHLLGLPVNVSFSVDEYLDHDQGEEEDVEAGEDEG